MADMVELRCATYNALLVDLEKTTTDIKVK